MAGREPMGSIALPIVFVIGNMRVPSPAAAITAVVTFMTRKP
jgi:hypothetical protein